MPTLIYLIIILLATSPISANSIVITEIHHSPTIGADIEFIEIHNRSEAAVSLSAWQLTKGIQYTFPKGIILEGGGYLLVAKDREKLIDVYQLEAAQKVLGPFIGRLDGDGECLVLKNALGKEIDRVNYKNKKTWPFCQKGQELSLQLINPTFDNRIGQYWAVASPSPCAFNQAVFTTHLLPIIKQVDQHPKAPQSNEMVTIVANVRNATSVALWYQVVAPGQYISLSDSSYKTNWIALQMLDDGKGGDLKAADRVYTLQMPAKLQQHRHLIRYKIVAKGDSNIIAPRQSSPQLNFAYYTYNNLPDYQGFSFDSLKKLPVCQLIAKAEEVQDLIYESKKRAYTATGTVVYNGVVYDHIGYRSRGYNNRHSRVKRNLKFNFHRNHKISVLNNQGIAYPSPRNKLVLSGGWLLDNPNTHGLSESVLYRLFTLQGASATYADYMHLRVVKHENESDSLEGDFWGLYLMLENYDGDFLETHDLPDANIYSYKPFKIRHQSPENVDLQAQDYMHWDTSCTQIHGIDWWKKELDWENYIRFLIANELVANKESGYRKQHWWTEYQQPEKGWQFFPWDVDRTWTSLYIKSTISSDIFKAAFQHRALKLDYKNELRSVLDLLFNEEQMFKLIEEQAAFIYQPQLGHSFVDLDKLRWGHDYEGSFETQIDLLKRFVKKRRAFILKKILNDSIPDRPQIRYKGTAQYTIDSLQFKALNFNRKTTQAIQWQVAEVSKKTAAIASKRGAKNYEIASTWKRAFVAPFRTTLSLPLGVVEVGRKYRIRVRVQDTTGYYSHWSEAMEFVPTKVARNYGKELVINELLFKSKGGVEFVELYNPSDQAINLAHFKFGAGITFEFSNSAIIEADSYWVLTNDLSLFETEYKFEANGVYKGKLSNKGEQIILYNAFGELIDSVQYSIDLQGEESTPCRSLELVYTTADNALAANWNCALNIQGTPGRMNSVLSEASYWSPWYWALCFCLMLLLRTAYNLQKKKLFMP